MKKEKKFEMDSRVNMRLPKDIMSRLRKQAHARGLHLSAYLRLRLLKILEEDEANGSAPATE